MGRDIEEEIQEDLNQEEDEDVYSEEGREDLLEDDEISSLEEGFMKGYEEDKKMAKCCKCQTVLGGMGEIVEREIRNEIYRFCSEECAEGYTPEE